MWTNVKIYILNAQVYTSSLIARYKFAFFRWSFRWKSMVLFIAMSKKFSSTQSHSNGAKTMSLYNSLGIAKRRDTIYNCLNTRLIEFEIPLAISDNGLKEWTRKWIITSFVYTTLGRIFNGDSSGRRLSKLYNTQRSDNARESRRNVNKWTIHLIKTIPT